MTPILRGIVIAVVAVAGIAVGTLIAQKLDPARPAELINATRLPAGRALPSFSLLDQDGAVLDAETLRGDWTLLFFGFTSCPDICPTTLQTLAAVERELIEAGSDIVPRVLFISVDPERDSPAQTGEYARYFSPRFFGATGDGEAAAALRRELGVAVAKRASGEGDYSIDHTSAVFVISPQVTFAAVMGAPHQASSIAHDFRLITASAR